MLISDRTRAAEADPAFLQDILAGLSRSPKSTPARWFYDRRGSELFEKITDLPEYYPTRTETALLRSYSGDVAALAGAGRAVVEFGAGSAVKTPHLLSAIAPAAYVPIDISGDFLRDSSAALAARFPGLLVEPVVADFTAPVPLPASIATLPKLGFFPGSTIGNMGPAEAVDLLRSMRRSLVHGAVPPMLLIGMDRVKAPEILVRAYDDATGVTAAFNLNLLVRINRELEGDIPVEAFDHRAVWNDDAARIEMHLVARSQVDFSVASRAFTMQAGESIHTENSHKYGARDARLLLRAGGWTPRREWIDEDGLFAMILAEAPPPGDWE